MMDILRDPGFRRLFDAQFMALVGTGLATAALALPACDLAGGQAGAVLGTALAIKIMVCVLRSPVAGVPVRSSAWPKSDPDLVEHAHPEPFEDHPHRKEHASSDRAQAHACGIDDMRRHWPRC